MTSPARTLRARLEREWIEFDRERVARVAAARQLAVLPSLPLITSAGFTPPCTASTASR